MNEELEQRQVVAWEAIASALAGINETARTVVGKLWPEPKPAREPIVTIAESEEERVKKKQGELIAKGEVNQWLSEGFGGEDEEFVGEREREYLARQRAARAQSGTESGAASGGSETPQSEAGTTGEGSEGEPSTQAS